MLEEAKAGSRKAQEKMEGIARSTVITCRIGPQKSGDTQPERVLNSNAGGSQIEVVK